MKERSQSSADPKKRVYAINSKGEASPQSPNQQQAAHQDYADGGQQGDVQTSIGQADARDVTRRSQRGEKTDRLSADRANARPDQQQR